VQSLARKAGLPAWIVELRHDATHNALPHLPLLRLAVTALLAWFEEHYWSPQAAHLAAIGQLCAGIQRRYVGTARGNYGAAPGLTGTGHRVGVDDAALRTALADLPPTSLAAFFLPRMLELPLGGRCDDDWEYAWGSAAFQPLLVPFLSPDHYPTTADGVAALYFKMLPMMEALQVLFELFLR